MIKEIETAPEKALSSQGLTPEEARRLLEIERPEEIFFLLAQANLVRRLTRGDEIELCAIINAKSGRCSEDCAFCAQSAHFRVKVDAFPLLQPEAVIQAAAQAKTWGVSRFSLVISGREVTIGPELDQIAAAIEGLAGLGLSPCASLGLLDEKAANVLKNAGLRTYHHNLETAPSFFPRICSTHTMADRLRTARLAKTAGFRLCCGGIIGLGESRDERVELAFTLRGLEPDSVPLNFLNPIPGTPLEAVPPLSPLEILKTIAVFRLVMPRTDLRTCGGREKNLRGLQALMFLAGANATMTGNYLTTSGRGPQEDVRDILDLGLKIRPAAPD
ncbi:MAG: biotin synthase BioB [Thermodesulfobacteriota bacterium]